ncbi:MAG TPA: glycosyltransferase family 2 protein [candidate division WOR-3 bacterium]|uniref:Glycosyltransferase family 2 protein n=1 Tax=candidate division WOR-3 bacterium TaxID=2052148 RepID=A0A7V0XF24_UNCW3|nr:glycosyltransferase family 2 protein [candidate division WOR-3 bacterium]
MRLSVIIPVYNEADSIAELIARVKTVPVKKEILVVDDHSSDRTLEVLRSIPDIRVFSHDRNCGKGASIRTGLARATGDIVIIQDADLEYDPADYPTLLAPFADPAVDAVYGSRFRGDGRFLLHSLLANRFLTMLTNALFGGRVTDMETCYKAIRRPLFLGLKLASSRFEIEPEITAKLLRRRARIIEVPIRYRARTEGKKIGPKDGILACCHLLKWYAS